MNKVFLIAAAAGLALGVFADEASAQFQNTLVDPPATFGDNNQVNNINEAESILASPPAGSTITSNTSDIISFPAGAPVGFAGDDFATESTGMVDVIGGTSLSGVVLYVNSDDGFRLRVNGTTVSEFIGDTGGSNTASGPLTLNDGDIIRLTFYERAGGEYIRFRLNDDNGPFIGSDASGIDIIPVPEPAALSLLALGGLGLLARRRRA